ncbi:lipase member H-like [Lasioglossum baleicum]|uniref:lipase member H-like n=1 Tax=Lasioglossum baleicum TaxID=434251 RepID=UPI003FCCE36E
MMTNNRLFLIFAISVCFISATVLSFNTGTISLRLYSKNGSYIQLNAKQASQFVPHMDLTLKTLFYCHGYLQSTDSDIVVQLIHSFLAGFNYNIIAVDYRHEAADIYPLSAGLSESVAMTVIDSLNAMVAVGLNKNEIIFYGHSLGAQISGEVGRGLSYRLEKIMGLDPAGPGFEYYQQSLSAADALCVICIHTDMYNYGNPEPCGHLDFYPNGGFREQPGCPVFSFTDPGGNCSHIRSEKYMIEAATHPNAFLSKKCPSWYDFTLHRCKKSDKFDVIPMGDSSPCSAAGKYYLQTNAESPFAKGLEGTVYRRNFYA